MLAARSDQENQEAAAAEACARWIEEKSALELEVSRSQQTLREVQDVVCSLEAGKAEAAAHMTCKMHELSLAQQSCEELRAASLQASADANAFIQSLEHVSTFWKCSAMIWF